MILIMAEQGTESVAEQIAGALSQEYNLPYAPEVVAVGAVWARSVEWDDLLLVVYRSHTLPESAVRYIQDYRSTHKTGGAILPVGATPAFSTPPDPISGIKAAKHDGSPELTGRIVKSAGVFLGLALRPGSQQIFVSYRASDGTPLAQAIHGHLKSAGFDPWLDEAGENLVIGDLVQDKIRRNIESAAMVLLIDTPDAPDSKWVSIEIDLAIGQLVPVLPVVAGGERISRFVALQGLRRQASVKQNGFNATPLSDAEWQGVQDEVEELLLSSFRRRLRILSRAQATFEANGYSWQAVDERLRMYRADKKTALLAKAIILSHCLVHDITYPPALKAYWEYLKAYPDVAKLNQKLCIYDRDKVLSEPEIQALSNNIPDMNVILAHYNELELLVASNFAALRK
jgi:hypothetical protein